MKMLKDDWLALGLEMLVDAGVAQVKIDPLCQRAGATKGSFYHHFKNREVFLTELLSYWREHYSQQLIDKVQNLPQWQQRRNSLLDLIDDKALAVESAVRHWAWQDEQAREAVQQVDQLRLQYLSGQCASMLPQAKQDKAGLLAGILYWKFVGCVQAGDQLDRDQWRQMDDLMAEMIEGWSGLA